LRPAPQLTAIAVFRGSHYKRQSFPRVSNRDVSMSHSWHEIEFRVRYQETDAMGVVHHANYLTWFEMGRTEMLRARGGSYRQMEERGQFLVIVRVECKYRRPARYDDWLRLRTILRRVSAAKIEHDYELYREAELLAEGHTVLACVDRDGVPQRIPEWLRQE
jgi:acyl-CoA thioester hydrolase